MNTFIWKLAIPIWKEVLLSTLLNVAITVCYLAQAMCLANLVIGLFFDTQATNNTSWAVLFLGATFIRIIVMALYELSALRTGRITKTRLHTQLIPKALSLHNHATGELVSTIVPGVNALESYYSRYIPAVGGALFGTALVLGVIVSFDWLSALILALCGIAIPIVDRVWLKVCRPEASQLIKAMGSFASAMLDSLQGITTLKSLNASDQRRSILAEKAAILRQQAMIILYGTLMRNFATSFIGLGAMAFVIIFGCFRFQNGEINVGALISLLFLVREVFRPIDKLDKTFHTAWAANSAAKPIYELLSQSDKNQPDNTPTKNSAGSLSPLHHDIVFSDVSFTWDQTQNGEPVLKDLNLSIKENEFVAIVGPSGAGKSTLSSLLMRFNTPQEGKITIGDIDLQSLTEPDTRALMSCVFQDTWLFHGSIEDNLRIAAPNVSLAAIHHAAKQANIHDFIMSLPDGYQTQIGERGSTLSGGQKQRLAFARACLKNAHIFILDEATASLDAENESVIQASLKAFAGKKTLIVIAHRLSTIQQADRILVLDKGRLVESGSHNTLISKGGLYSSLFQQQSQANRDDAQLTQRTSQYASANP